MNIGASGRGPAPNSWCSLRGRTDPRIYLEYRGLVISGSSLRDYLTVWAV